MITALNGKSRIMRWGKIPKNSRPDTSILVKEITDETRNLKKKYNELGLYVIRWEVLQDTLLI